MLLDLLRLASLGQNMELYASLQIRQPQNQSQSQNFTINTGRPAASNYATHPPPPPTSQPQSQEPHPKQAQAHTNHRREPTETAQGHCKPLDLSLPTTRPPEDARGQLKPLPATLGLSSRRRRPRPAPILLIPMSNRQRHKMSMAKDRLCSHTKSSNNVNNKLISSSTSPSTCSHHSPVSAASSEEGKISTSEAGEKRPEVISSTNGKRPAKANDVGDSTGRAFRRQKHKGLKSHLCHLCGRSFSRSDMLTRHSRLHSGLKPYQCSRCKQVFSRSDHLSTHERTHTGEKPYQCQYCAYSACRRDMITRHMRTHSGSHSGSSPHNDRPNGGSPPTTIDLLQSNNHEDNEGVDCRGRRRRFRPVASKRLRRASDPLAVSDISISSQSEDDGQFEDMDEMTTVD